MDPQYIITWPKINIIITTVSSSSLLLQERPAACCRSQQVVTSRALRSITSDLSVPSPVRRETRSLATLSSPVPSMVGTRAPQRATVSDFHTRFCSFLTFHVHRYCVGNSRAIYKKTSVLIHKKCYFLRPNAPAAAVVATVRIFKHPLRV